MTKQQERALKRLRSIAVGGTDWFTLTSVDNLTGGLWRLPLDDHEKEGIERALTENHGMEIHVEAVDVRMSAVSLKRIV